MSAKLQYVVGEAPHSPGVVGVHAEISGASQALIHGIDVISLWLVDCIPACGLKTPPHSFFSFL